MRGEQPNEHRGSDKRAIARKNQNIICSPNRRFGTQRGMASSELFGLFGEEDVVAIGHGFADQFLAVANHHNNLPHPG